MWRRSNAPTVAPADVSHVRSRVSRSVALYRTQVSRNAEHPVTECSAPGHRSSLQVVLFSNADQLVQRRTGLLPLPRPGRPAGPAAARTDGGSASPSGSRPAPGSAPASGGRSPGVGASCVISIAFIGATVTPTRWQTWRSTSTIASGNSNCAPSAPTRASSALCVQRLKPPGYPEGSFRAQIWRA